MIYRQQEMLSVLFLFTAEPYRVMRRIVDRPVRRDRVRDPGYFQKFILNSKKEEKDERKTKCIPL